MDGLGSAKRGDTLSFVVVRCRSLSFVAVRCRSLPFAEDNRERSRFAPSMLWVPPPQ